MKIAILTTDSIPLIGGVADYLHNFCTELSKSIQFDVYSTVPSNTQSDIKPGYPIHRIADTRQLGHRFGDGFSPLRKANTMLWYLKRPLEAHSLLKNIQNKHIPDLLLIGRWEERSHFWCRACCSMSVPYYLFAYGMELTEEKTLKWYKRRNQDFLNAKRVISISKGTTDTLMRMSGVPEDRIWLLYPGIRLENLEKVSADVFYNVLQKNGLSKQRYILSLCRLVKRKGVDLALHAFADIADDFPELFLAIAGDGPELSDLRSLAVKLDLHERVKFLGEVDDITKRSLFQGCEFFIMPNRPIPGDMEGFGIVFLEAAMFGKAVIGGNNGGVPDAVIDGETGLLTDTSNSHQPLTESMLKLLLNPGLARKIGNAGQDRAGREFSWVNLGMQFTDFLNK
ncbi:MAG: glycosyltransferase family 4 protein [Desulfobacterales bacterium]|nr:glycosyltransferase family 4 protein [Desulfobacterales bacterium]